MKVCLTLDHYNLYEITLYTALVLHYSPCDFASIKYMHKWLKEFSSSISQFQPLTSLEYDIGQLHSWTHRVVQFDLLCII